MLNVRYIYVFVKALAIILEKKHKRKIDTFELIKFTKKYLNIDIDEISIKIILNNNEYKITKRFLELIEYLVEYIDNNKEEDQVYFDDKFIKYFLKESINIYLSNQNSKTY